MSLAAPKDHWRQLTWIIAEFFLWLKKKNPLQHLAKSRTLYLSFSKSTIMRCLHECKYRGFVQFMPSSVTRFLDRWTQNELVPEWWEVGLLCNMMRYVTIENIYCFLLCAVWYFGVSQIKLFKAIYLSFGKVIWAASHCCFCGLLRPR